MNTRPRIKLSLTASDKFVEAMGWCAVAAVWVLMLASFSNLPQTIPIHYNLRGEADNFGQRSSLFILPALATVLFLCLTLLNRLPHIYNYPRPVTPENARAQYTIATRMIRVLKLAIVVVFALIIFKTTRDAQGKSEPIGIWLLPIVLVLIIGPVVYFLAKMLKTPRRPHLRT